MEQRVGAIHLPPENRGFLAAQSSSCSGSPVIFRIGPRTAHGLEKYPFKRCRLAHAPLVHFGAPLTFIRSYSCTWGIRRLFRGVLSRASRGHALFLRILRNAWPDQ